MTLAREAASYVARRLDHLETEYEKGWTGEAAEGGGLKFTRSLRGVTETHVLDSRTLHSAEARHLDSFGVRTSSYVYPRAPPCASRSRTTMLQDLSDLGVRCSAPSWPQGKKGVSLQRYKGLGEMNPGQLWETTLDPNVRTLLQVKVNHADEANEVFSTLMGDVVEHRRDFIQENALNVRNLDV